MTVYSTSPTVQTALMVIQEANFPHPAGESLVCFIENSIDNEQAATFMFQWCAGQDENSDLFAFSVEWKKLISICKFFTSELDTPLPTLGTFCS